MFENCDEYWMGEEEYGCDCCPFLDHSTFECAHPYGFNVSPLNAGHNCPRDCPLELFPLVIGFSKDHYGLEDGESKEEKVVDKPKEAGVASIFGVHPPPRCLEK